MVDQRSWVHMLSVISRGCVLEINLWVLPALLQAEGKGDELDKHVSRPTPYWASVGHPQMEGGGGKGLYHPPAQWCHHEGVEEDSSGNLWSSGELHAQEG